MKKNLILISLLLLFYLPLTAVQTPKLEIDKSVIDLGKIEQRKSYEFMITLKNTGLKPLNIKNIKPDCGCTMIESTIKEIMPGKDTVIKGKYTSSSYPGKVNKKIRIYSNDPEQDVTVIAIQGEIIALFQINPPNLRIANPENEVEEIIKNQFTIKNNKNENFKIKRIECDIDFIKAKIIEKKDTEYKIEVLLYKNKIPQFKSYNITIPLKIMLNYNNVLRQEEVDIILYGHL